MADVHGNSEAPARARDGADALVVLGDLIDFVDYRDRHRGILGEIFGAEVVVTFAWLRIHGRPGELTGSVHSLDVVSRRAEVGSRALLGIVARDRPRVALFGHVHQPMASRSRVYRTECVNVGHFRRTERPYVLTW